MTVDTATAHLPEMVRIERQLFGPLGFDRRQLQSDLEWAVAIVGLRHQGRLIGYSYALKGSRRRTAHIYNTAIARSHQDRGYLGRMMAVLERTLRAQGFAYLERDAACAGGYADAITRHYGSRIIRSHAKRTRYGPQRFFRIRL